MTWNHLEADAQAASPSSPVSSSPSGESIFQGQPSQPRRVVHSAQDKRLERLRELRRQRQQSGTGQIPSGEYQRRGVPTPPPPQPAFQEIIKHWWRHGSFPDRETSSSLSNSQPSSGGSTSGSAPAGTQPGQYPLAVEARPWEARARAWLTQGRKTIAIVSVKAQVVASQAKSLLNQKMQSRHKSARSQEIVPGLIVLGFAPAISRQEAAKVIGSLGGRPLRHKAALNVYQVAVSPGQEELLIQQYLHQPGVVFASLEQVPSQH